MDGSIFLNDVLPPASLLDLMVLLIRNLCDRRRKFQDCHYSLDVA
jgi:hypothetical protein